MKKTFEIIGLFALVFFSIYYSEQITTVIKNNDGLLEEIKLVSQQYKVEEVDATIVNDTIIPGINGRIIDVENSYTTMNKSGGIFNENLIEYQIVPPKISVNKVYDKYIVSGNKSKNHISLIFIVDEDDSIDNILNILENKNVKASFFIAEEWLEKNNEKVQYLVSKSHIVGIMKASDINWMDSVINDYLKQEDGFCLAVEFDDAFLNKCKIKENYTIKPNLIIDKNPLTEFKNYLTNGAIVAFEVTDELNSQFSNIIEYANYKDSKLMTISELIKE